MTSSVQRLHPMVPIRHVQDVQELVYLRRFSRGKELASLGRIIFLFVYSSFFFFTVDDKVASRILPFRRKYHNRHRPTETTNRLAMKISLFRQICVACLALKIRKSGAKSSNNKQRPARPEHVLDALEKNEHIYYFGLGSNMSRKKLENRGMNGTKIDLLSFEAAIVPDYRLAFNMRGFPPIEPGMGSLEPVDSRAKALLTYKEKECHGALVKLTAENYKKVMASEGVSDESLNPGYEEIVVDAYPYRNSRKPVKAVALRARPHVRLSFDPSPSVRYMNILKEGAKELDLKPCYQEFLAQHPVQAIPKWQKKYAVYNLVFNRLLGRRLVRFQTRLLFFFYASATAPAPVRLLSAILSNLVLFPGFIFGFIFCMIAALIGKTPPFVTRMMTFLGASD
eukprot:scaffold1697_cov120-Cylindrotheca_fusiformis.AAC.14